jgi:hypothetical protein
MWPADDLGPELRDRRDTLSSTSRKRRIASTLVVAVMTGMLLTSDSRAAIDPTFGRTRLIS